MQQRLILTMVCWAIATLMPVAALAQTLSDQGPGVQNPVIGQLQDQALSSDLAWQTLAAITSEVGPRMAGSEADQRAVKWAVAKLHALGFERVWTEPVTFPRWVRNQESAEVLSPHAQKLAITALGGSPGSDGPLQAEIIQFESLAALEAASAEQVAGKIVFISQRMPRTRDGMGYGDTVVIRGRGPYVAASKGARALLIRSVGTDNDRLAHTGNISGTEPGDPVPSAALSNPDADNLLLMLAGSGPVVVRLDLDVGMDGQAASYNVIGEFSGRQKTGKFILLGAHLDSWDLGTGAIDDGAGIAIVTAAASLVAGLPERPRHGIRVVLYANEEQGIFGGKAYAARHAEELDNHLIGAESDMGSDRIYAFRTRVVPAAESFVTTLARHLERLGIERDPDSMAHGGADVGQMGKLGMALIDMNQDASRYFDLHHTANDTLDKVDPDSLRQNLAAWVTLVYLAANSDMAFGPLTPEPSN